MHKAVTSVSTSVDLRLSPLKETYEATGKGSWRARYRLARRVRWLVTFEEAPLRKAGNSFRRGTVGSSY